MQGSEARAREVDPNNSERYSNGWLVRACMASSSAVRRGSITSRSREVARLALIADEEVNAWNPP